MLEAKGHIMSWCKSTPFFKPMELHQFTAVEDLCLSLARLKPLTQTLDALPNLKLPLTVVRAIPTGGKADYKKAILELVHFFPPRLIPSLKLVVKNHNLGGSQEYSRL